VDKCLGRKIVPGALREAGLLVEIKEDHFAPDTADTVWVPDVGARGWIILSKDSSMRHNHIELVALLRSNTHSFILTAASQTGKEMASALVFAIPQMQRIVDKFSPPCVSAVTPSGSVNVYLPHNKLLSQIADNLDAQEGKAALERTQQPPP
jgi:hypothetical protein